MKRVSLLILILIILLGFSFSGKAQTNLEKIFEFPNGEVGHGVINNANGTLLVTRYKENDDKEIAWYSHKKIIKEILNVEQGRFSPDGKYYSYIKSDVLYIYNEKNKLINKFPQKSYSGGITWSWDSKYIFIDSEQLHKYNVNSGTDEIILIPKKTFHPVTVNDQNVLYLLKPQIPAADSDSDIIKYDLITKKFQLIKLPENLSAFGYFTISPNEKIVILECYGFLNVVDLTKNEIIDKIETPKSCEVMGYSWANDSTSLTFTMTGREIYKYTIPSIPSISLLIKLENLLTTEYAKNILQNPGGKEISLMDQ